MGPGITRLGLGEQRGLVALDLEQIVTALFPDGAGRRLLAVQRIGGDKLVVQRRQAVQQSGGGGLFATLGAFLLIVDRDGVGRTVFVLGRVSSPM